MGITIQQLSVFLENREGRLDEVLSVLAGNDINIVALSLADTSEYGMLRMIVSDPNKGKAVLKENGITSMLTDVVALRVRQFWCAVPNPARFPDLIPSSNPTYG